MITLKSLSKRYKDYWALKDVSFIIDNKPFFGIIGPTGAGKTTLLRLIAGFEMPDNGSIFIDDTEVSSKAVLVPPHRRNINMVFQGLYVWPHMNARQNVFYMLKDNRNPRSESENKADEYLKIVGLSPKKNLYPTQLSEGEKQRLAFARAMSSEPRYLLLDEALSNIDPVNKNELLLELKRRTKESDLQVIIASHDHMDIARLCDRIAIMNDGKLEQFGNLNQILGKPNNSFVKRFFVEPMQDDKSWFINL